MFISWSGERSREVAAYLYEWLPCVIQAAQPWMSSKDIDKGSIWFNEINDELKDTAVGIICITKENKNKPWILFEAGALLKGLSSNRVIPLLIDLEIKDIESPLSQFNATLPTREGMLGLVRSINNELQSNKLKENVLDSSFNTYWDQFNPKFNEIMEDTHILENKVEERSEKEILSEILNTTRTLEKKLRSIDSSEKTYAVPEVLQRKMREEILKLMNEGNSRNEIVSKLSTLYTLPERHILNHYMKLQSELMEEAIYGNHYNAEK
ncbi:TIR domain-containing protein [Chengkuizengella marina]|uniref:TIR domain-containing protein n=1 Tax=Chengkuizengella marina TaxID=2507566 RepID=UPI002E29E93E|nr:TIR domain-containing protein [Chengkuizengella marina]